jgi:hypothetical protein
MPVALCRQIVLHRAPYSRVAKRSLRARSRMRTECPRSCSRSGRAGSSSELAGTRSAFVSSVKNNPLPGATVRRPRRRKGVPCNRRAQTRCLSSAIATCGSRHSASVKLPSGSLQPVARIGMSSKNVSSPSPCCSRRVRASRSPCISVKTSFGLIGRLRRATSRSFGTSHFGNGVAVRKACGTTAPQNPVSSVRLWWTARV